MKAADKFWAFIGGAVIGYLIGAFTHGTQQVNQDTRFTIATLGAYLGAAMMITVYAKWKPIVALWGFWIMLAIAIVWSL
ncbi:MAG TPA: hypothetical protein VJ843_05490 [Candidatus Saccharimonadales bacterium]|nr:hypothetical protein [Candidatus Saccharimonadales bacterium]